MELRVSKADTKPTDLDKLYKKALVRVDDNTAGLVLVGCHIVAALDRVARAINRQTAALRPDGSLEDRDALDAAEAEARAELDR
jgi:hypothetical protein